MSSTFSSRSDRLISLDIFRGATIAAMILVNNAGDEPSSYLPLRHSSWNGWTPTDLVFPFFLFIVGVATVFSLASRIHRGDRKALLPHVFWRGFVLFALGLLINGFPDHYQLASLRFYGVLQRIAVCYILSAMIELCVGWKGQAAIVVACLAGYWVVMRYCPVPGFGTPGRDIPLLDPDKNLAAWLDRKLLFGHLYEGTRDPEGMLSTIPALATTVSGLLTGKWLRSQTPSGIKLRSMLTCAVAAIALGELFGRYFPINKKLWTSSYVLLTAGFAILALTFLYWALDINRRRGRWTIPFLVFGLNSIAAYVLSELVPGILNLVKFKSDDGLISLPEAIYERVFLHVANPANASLLYACCYVCACWVVMWTLYRKDIFIRI